jgi:hypothetical protein
MSFSPAGWARGLLAPPLLALSLAGCGLLVDVDRSLIPGGSGGGGGSGTGGATSTSTGTGGIECLQPADCPGTDAACTARTCEQGHCGVAPVASGTPTSHQLAGDCQREVCDGAGAAVLVADDADVPIDGDPCTDDVCTQGAPANPHSAVNTPCSVDGGAYCDGAGHCVACVAQTQCPPGLACVNNQCVTCLNHQHDGSETDVDCGGPTCAACAAGKKCLAASDCTSLVCAGAPALCQPATCGDHVQNGDEVGVDCGGSCPKCPAGQPCGADADCAGGACQGGVCQPTCADLAQNGGETDVDCGGGCPKCATGQHCGVDADCVGGACQGAVCQPTCSDGLQNLGETDVDCGGGGCPPCGAGQHCGAGADCVSALCLSGSCLAPSCADHQKDADETDVDCGGSCLPCPAGGGCAAGADCASLVCASLVCAAPSCTDGVRNGVEAGLDCGALSGCGLCANGRTCGGDGDCASSICTAGLCVPPSCGDHLQNQGESDVDCGGGVCLACAPGKHCTLGADCASNVCTAGFCATPSCSDGQKNGTESDVDCGGPGCTPCVVGAICAVDGDCQSLSCQSHLCAGPTCSDAVKNGAETGVDCGGPTCAKCGAGQGCVTSTDCAAPTTCGGGGASGVCGCTPDPVAVTCGAQTCGSAVDNCGGTTSCGTCSYPYTCGGGGAAGACGCPNPAGCHLTTLMAKSFGGAEDNDGFGIAIAGSHILLGGSFVSEMNFGGGNLISTNNNDDAAVAWLDLSGNYVWAHRYGDAAKPQFAFAVAADPAGNALVAGIFASTIDFGGGLMTSNGSSDAFVAKLDPAGNQIWAHHYGDGTSQTSKTIASDGAGNVYVAGGYQGTMNFGGGNLPPSNGLGNMFLAKLDASGNYLWAKGMGDFANPQLAYGVASDAAGNVVVVGSGQGSIDFGGGPLTTAGDMDVLLAAYTPSGALRWARVFGDALAQNANGVAVDPAGNVLVTGFFAGTINFGGATLTATGVNDLFVAKFDPQGHHLWSLQAGGDGDTEANGITTDAAGNIFVVGSFTGTMNCGTGPVTSAGDLDALVLEYTPGGTCLQARRYGDSSPTAQIARSVSTDAAGNVYVFGDYDGTLDVDIGPLTTLNLLDAFLLKLSP